MAEETPKDSREEENDEFMDLAQARGKKVREPFEPKDDEGDGDDDEEPEPGEPVQWAIHGPGFIPATKTIKKIKPDAYSFQVIANILTLVPQKLVTDHLLRLPDSRSDEVIAEIEKFWTLKKNFKKFGYTHKRGFLLWGPPGSGKTSTVTFVTRQIVEEGGIAFLVGGMAPELVANMLKKFRAIHPAMRALVVIEDIDTVIERHGEAEVLSLLDGETSIDNVVFVATTNYPEQLDGRIVNRPSRFDRVVKISEPSPEARKAYLQSRELGITEEELDKWVECTDKFSIAHLKEVVVGCLCFGETIEAVTKRLKAMQKTPKSSESGRSAGFSHED